MPIVESLKAANPARETSKNAVVLPRGNGISLEVTVFAPPERPRNLVLISAATGVPQRFYFGYAEHLAELGWACVTYDYFGVACSRPVSRRWLDVGLQTWVADIEAVLRFCERRFRDVPITLLGHSVGGLVSLLAPISTSVRRVVTVAAQPSYWKDWPLRVRFTRCMCSIRRSPLSGAIFQDAFSASAKTCPPDLSWSGHRCAGLPNAGRRSGCGPNGCAVTLIPSSLLGSRMTPSGHPGRFNACTHCFRPRT